MSVTNCSAAGADSTTAPITGVVTRKDKTTGQQVAAAVRPNGVPEQTPAPKVEPVKSASLSSSTLSAVLNFQG